MSKCVEKKEFQMAFFFDKRDLPSLEKKVSNLRPDNSFLQQSLMILKHARAKADQKVISYRCYDKMES